MAKRHQPGVVVTDTVNGAGAETPDQACKAIFLADLRRPAVEVTAEAYAGGMWQVVILKALALHHLDQDGHPFIIILQPLATPVKQGIGVQRAGIDLGDRTGEIAQVL